MKILLLFLLLSTSAVAQTSHAGGDSLALQDTFAIEKYPCTTPIPQEYGFLFCIGGTEYRATLFKASFRNNKLSLRASKPNDGKNMYPMLVIQTQTKGKPGIFKTTKQIYETYAKLTDRNSQTFMSYMHSGSCLVNITTLTEEVVMGNFSVTGYDQQGTNATLVTGAFRVAIDKQ